MFKLLGPYDDTIEVTNKAVDLSVVTVQTVRSVEVKEEIKNE